MKIVRKLVAGAILALVLSVGVGCKKTEPPPVVTTELARETLWLTDYEEAQKRAKESNRLLLVDFTGSDWCGWCIKLDREVFSQPAFQEYATKNLVLMQVDFPKGKPQTAEQKAQNQQLAMRHRIQGFPTIIVLNAEGRKIAELGYIPGGAAAFIAELDKLRKG